MNQLFFDHALLPDGWAQNVLIEADENGVIANVFPESTPPTQGANAHIAVAGMANLHSHAFQRAMAGLGEWAGDSTQTDSFWSWREVMYRFLEKIHPEDLYVIAQQTYVEMLEAGFTAVGEFHYLHHQPDGSPYDALSEMSQQLMQAASDVGISQTLLPVFYAQGGFDSAPIQVTQKRFYNDAERFLLLVEECHTHAPPRTMIGIAPHSLRAVTPQSLADIVIASPDMPIHIHIAEQQKEVQDCLRWSGKRPVEWLLDNHSIDTHWCLVHATHLNESEIKQLAASQAVAGLCPITEANLGDGIFEGVAYKNNAGRWGIGSDSNIRIDVAEELRSYEYSQRLRDQARNRIATAGSATGRILYDAALSGGAQALNQKIGRIEIGHYCDIVSLDSAHPALAGKNQGDWLNSWIFAGDKSCVEHVWCSGTKQVTNGTHQSRQSIGTKFAHTIKSLIV